MIRAGSGVLALVLGGCALASKARPVEVRYFDPEPAAMTARATPADSTTAIRLGRVTAGAHLRLRILHRRSPLELHAYDTLRWAEYPETYVRRALEGALYADRGLAQVVGGAAPTLDVEVVAFERATTRSGDVGRVELRYRIRDEHAVLAAGAIRVERPARTRGMDGVVGAIGAALAAATGELADRVSHHITPPRADRPGPRRP